MDLIHEPPTLPETVVAELVIQNGRLKGTSRPLELPVLVLGRSAECDLRLNVDGVAPRHCLLAQGPDGLVIRNLADPQATLVNGRPVSIATLQSGDQLAVGPFLFQVRLNAPTAVAKLAEVQARHAQEKDALRIQAAAVAAQQAALLEEEGRLQQRAQALEQQEGQLAKHLEEKRRKLIEVRDQVRAAQTTLKTQREQHGNQVVEARRELDAARRELADGKQQVEARRQRLRKLLGRMRQRWHRHWTAERAVIQKREVEVARRQAEHDQELAHLRREAANLKLARLRFNGEAELGRRQIKDQWAELRHDQVQFEERRACEEANFYRRQKGLDRRQIALTEGEQELAEQQVDWQEARLDLEKEVEGLENRVRQHRHKIFELETEASKIRALIPEAASAEAAPENAAEPNPAAPAAAPTDANPPDANPATSTAPAQPVAPRIAAQQAPLVTPASLVIQEPVKVDPARLANLDKVADDLADQRLHLAEQWERLMQAQERWQQHREGIAAELEVVGRRLHDQERVLEIRSRNLDSAERRLRDRQVEIAGLQNKLECWQARMTARENSWDGERDRLVASLTAREQIAERRLTEVTQVNQRWSRRRKRELVWLQTERAALEKLRQEAASLRDDYLLRNAKLEQGHRALAERALAMEQYHQETVEQSENPAGAERRLQKLQARWSGLAAAAEKTLAVERKAVEAEAARQQELSVRLTKQIAKLHTQDEELSERLRGWEEERLKSADELDRLRHNLAVSQSHRDRFEQQVTDLRDEVERLARILLDEGEPPLTLPLPNAQAA